MEEKEDGGRKTGGKEWRRKKKIKRTEAMDRIRRYDQITYPHLHNEILRAVTFKSSPRRDVTLTIAYL